MIRHSINMFFSFFAVVLPPSRASGGGVIKLLVHLLLLFDRGDDPSRLTEWLTNSGDHFIILIYGIYAHLSDTEVLQQWWVITIIKSPGIRQSQSRTSQFLLSRRRRPMLLRLDPPPLPSQTVFLPPPSFAAVLLARQGVNLITRLVVGPNSDNSVRETDRPAHSLLLARWLYRHVKYGIPRNGSFGLNERRWRWWREARVWLIIDVFQNCAAARLIYDDGAGIFRSRSISHQIKVNKIQLYTYVSIKHALVKIYL